MDEELYQKLIHASLRFVSIRPRSIYELKNYLHKKLSSSSESTVIHKAVMTRLVDLGYADDRKFIAWWVRARQSTKARGLRVIRHELMTKGIEKELVEEVIDLMQKQEFLDTGGPQEILSDDQSARIAIQKKIKAWSHLPQTVQKKKLTDFLMRLGFSYDVIRPIVDESVGHTVQ